MSEVEIETLVTRVKPIPRIMRFSIFSTAAELAVFVGGGDDKYTLNNAFWRHIFTQN